MVTRQGAEILSVLCSRLPGEPRITAEEGVSIAAGFLEDQGFRNMKESYHMTENGVLTVNFQYTENGVVCYPDMIKVGVALDNGSLAGWDAKGYLSSHRERKLEERYKFRLFDHERDFGRTSIK